METNNSEPLLKCRKRWNVIKTRGVGLTWDKFSGDLFYWLDGDRHGGEREHGMGFCVERWNLSFRC